MKTIKVPYIEEFDNKSLKECNQLIEKLGETSIVETVNWEKEYPYAPITFFDIARSKDAIYIKYRVRGTSLKAVYTEDQSDVYKDSCVEFFCMPKNAEKYTNFEFNCIGTCLASSRKGREEEITPFSKEEMKTIERYSSLPRKPFKELEGHFEWELCVKIPFELMGLDRNNLPQKIRGNFYKCGDETKNIHFVSWSPIPTETPDFHQPKFFGELYLK